MINLGQRVFVVYSVCLLPIVLSIAGCDVPYLAEVCSSFGEPAKIIFVDPSRSQNRMLLVASGECIGTASDAWVHAGDREQELRKTLPEGVIVLSVDNRVLARYDFDPFILSPALHEPLRIMIAEDGAFLVPYELRKSWLQNSVKVKQLSKRSWPALPV